MQHIKRTGFTARNQSLIVLRSCLKPGPSKSVSNLGFSAAAETSIMADFSKRVARQVAGNSILVRNQSPFQLGMGVGRNITSPLSVRSFASNSTEPTRQKGSQARKEISTVEDPFDDAPTYNIPEKPVTFTEGASYSLIILAGLGIAGFAAYGVLNELVFQPKEHTIFSKALDRVQNDSQVRVRIGSPIKGYGTESRNRAARQRIPNKIWTDEDGVEHIMINFNVRGPHGAGKVFTEMFKDKTDKQWKFMYLIVEVTSPSPAQLMLESYVPT